MRMLPFAEAALLSATGLPTVGVLETLEYDLKKPVLSSNQASLRRALRLASIRQARHGFWELVEGNLGGLYREPMRGHHGSALQA
jgi:maleate cis-trans isomerase